MVLWSLSKGKLENGNSIPKNHFIPIALYLRKEVKIDDENIYGLSKWTIHPTQYRLENPA